MPNSKDFLNRARRFSERAEKAEDQALRQHLSEMAAHYRMLAVEHQEIHSEGGR
jgi:hypothetical protein